jgi:hypothetical protein
MFRSAKMHSILVLAASVLVAGLVEERAFAANKITDLKVSSDSRRVVVTCDGPMIPAGVCRLEGPSKLAIDIPGIGLGDIAQSVQSSEGPSLEARVARTPSGVRLVLDFGEKPVPEHKIRRLENCLMVLLSPWATVPNESWSAPAGDHSPPPPPTPRVPKQRERKPPSVSSHGVMEIKSAEVVNGLIVLKVVRKDNPARVYRIDLGVNLDKSGFNSANIYPAKESRVSSRPVSQDPHSLAGTVRPEVGSPVQRPSDRAGAEEEISD